MSASTPQSYLADAQAKLTAQATAITNAEKVMTSKGGKASLANAVTLNSGIAADVAVALAAINNPPAPAPAPTPAPAGLPWLSGVYVAAADTADVEAFASWRGAPVTLISDYLNHAGSWASIDNPSWWTGAYQPLTSKGVVLALGVPLLQAGTDTFQAGASGAFDAHFTNLANALVAGGCANAILRLGWEFNGNWYAWSVTPTGANSPANFVAYWQRIVRLMRAVKGQQFRFCWNPNNGPAKGGWTTTDAYPGDTYVDFIGVDAYDEDYSQTGATPQARWTYVTGQTEGLNFWAAFAQQHSKPICLPEWGLTTDSSGGGDDPYYVQQVYAFMQASGGGFEALYDYGRTFTPQAFPNAAAEYQKLYSTAS